MTVSHASKTVEPVSFLALGDSYTRGEGVDADRSWPVALAQALTGSGLPVSNPRVVAETGWTTEDLARAMDQTIPDRTFDLVSLLIGVNDQYQGRQPSHFETSFLRVLDRTVGLAGNDPGRVMVLSIPDWGVTPHAEGKDREEIGRQIEEFNEVKMGRSRAVGANFIDLTQISREEGGRPQFLSADGLHPSGAMYSLWVDLLLPVALRILDHGSGGGS
jgi:lysophospholipase L1-like esterase